MSGEIRETLSSDFENPDSYYTKLSWRCKNNTPCIVYPFNCYYGPMLYQLPNDLALLLRQNSQLTCCRVTIVIRPIQGFIRLVHGLIR
jgi:hypothetical protein